MSRFQIHTNRKMKEQFANQILMVQDYLEIVNYERERFQVSSENKAKAFASDIAPKKVLDLVKMESENS